MNPTDPLYRLERYSLSGCENDTLFVQHPHLQKSHIMTIKPLTSGSPSSRNASFVQLDSTCLRARLITGKGWTGERGAWLD